MNEHVTFSLSYMIDISFTQRAYYYLNWFPCFTMKNIDGLASVTMSNVKAKKKLFRIQAC